MPFPRPHLLVPVLLLALTACGNMPAPSATASIGGSPVETEASAAPTASPSPGVGQVVPAPGSSSEIYEPNPGAITVAIDPGHGGCLDFGVPDPSKRGVDYAEKTMTLGIGLALRKLLTEQGIGVVMTRTDDSALAGDDYPQLGCNGPAWRDVNGDGQVGFDPAGLTRTRDELSARIDLANVARADVLVSIHINSLTQNGKVFAIGASETYYDDESAWAETSKRLAEAIQAGVVSSMDGVASYERQDRGIANIGYYVISRQWRSSDACEDGGQWCRPHRAVEMPAILTEVGSITLPAEQDLLVTPAGQQAAAQGIFEGLTKYFADRPLAVRYDLLAPGGEAGQQPQPVAGDGPMFWPPVVAASGSPLPVRLTNNGTEAWPDGLRLLAGWQASEVPYLADPPADIAPLPVEVPSLAPGESVELAVPLPAPSAPGRQVAWISLSDGSRTLAELGSPPLQVATGP